MQRALRVLFLLAALAAILPRYTSLEQVPEATTPRAALRQIPLPDAQLTEQELETRRTLEARVREEVEGDLVIQTSGRKLKGRITEESAHAIRLEQSFRDAGVMSSVIPRSAILKIERAPEIVPEITLRDVRFQLEFPHLNLYHRPPYTIVTAKNFFEVAETTRVLQELHSEFLQTFRPLATQLDRNQSIQLLFFSKQEEFESYRDERVSGLPNSVGFYAPTADRLVIFDQRASEEASEVTQMIHDAKAEYHPASLSYTQRRALASWEAEAKREFGRVVDHATRSVLRHEGAHQLFYNYGIHSPHQAEHLWLIEGLAVYCQEDVIGRRSEDALHELRAARHRLPRFRELVDLADIDGFSELVAVEDIPLVYEQSALIVHELMRPATREAFFNYIRAVRDPEHAARLERVSHFELLAESLGVSPDELERRLESALRANLRTVRSD